MKNLYLAFLIIFVAACASKPLELEEKTFSSESAFKVVSEVNRIVPFIQKGSITVGQLAEIVREDLAYDVTTGEWVGELSNYTVRGRFDGELKDQDTALYQVRFQIVPQEFLLYSDLEAAFGAEYRTTRFAQTVVIQKDLEHAKNVEFLIHLSESATNASQPVRSLLLRPKR